MKRIFKTRPFARWSRKTGLSDASLNLAVEEMTHGLFDADLGGGVFKKRVALPGRGKSGGTRTLLATNLVDYWFFMHGFAKNERANISSRELEALRKFAVDLLALSSGDLDEAIMKYALEEVFHDG
ncbi:MAG: type II toxin-antitoxin system RelE/ParE family toxin [Magnetococcus sp. DMHC-1]|nr:type II toxin-antitoxin system RelE/ParE family toxin [Magnetococcales bacterium]